MFLFLSLAAAADLVEGAETLALGSTSVANPWSNTTLSSNPGAIGVNPRYHFGFAGSYGGRGMHWNITAADSKTTALAFGITYSGDRFNPPLTVEELPGWIVPDQVLTNRKRNHDLGVALAVPMFDHRLSIGMGGSLSFFNHERQGKGNTGNLTAGIGARPADTVFLGVSVRNFVPIDDPNADRPMEVLGGVHLLDPKYGSLSLEGGARPERDTGLLVLGAGGEIAVSEGVMIRGGWRMEDAAHRLTFGAGAGTQQAGVDLGFALPTESLLQPADWTVQLSIRIEGPDIDKIQPN